MAQQNQNPTDFELVPGEQNVYRENFLTSLLIPYTPTQLMCSSTRFVYSTTDTVLRAVPTSPNQASMPIHSIVGVNTTNKLELANAVLGFIALIFAMNLDSIGLGDSIVVPLLLFVIAVVLFATGYSSVLLVQNSGGTALEIAVAVSDQKKLKDFARELQNRVFGDQPQSMHEQQAMFAQTPLQQEAPANQPGVPSQGFANPDFAQPGFVNPGVPNQGFAQPGFAQPGFAEPVVSEQGFAQSGFAQPGVPNQGFVQPGFAEPVVSEQGFVQSGFAQPGVPNQGFVQPGFAEPVVSEQGFVQSGFVQSGFAQPGFTEPAVPEQGFVQPGQGFAQSDFAQPGFTEPVVSEPGFVNTEFADYKSVDQDPNQEQQNTES